MFLNRPFVKLAPTVAGAVVSGYTLSTVEAAADTASMASPGTRYKPIVGHCKRRWSVESDRRMVRGCDVGWCRL